MERQTSHVGSAQGRRTRRQRFLRKGITQKCCDLDFSDQRQFESLSRLIPGGGHLLARVAGTAALMVAGGRLYLPLVLMGMRRACLLAAIAGVRKESAQAQGGGAEPRPQNHRDFSCTPHL